MMFWIFLAILAILTYLQGFSLATVGQAIALFFLGLLVFNWNESRFNRSRQSSLESGYLGRAGPRRSYVGTGEWVKLRAFALERAKYRCENCDADEDLQVHHEKPLSIGGRNELDNVHVLCRQCHQKEHGFEFKEGGNPDANYGSKTTIRNPKVRLLVNAIKQQAAVNFVYTRADRQTSTRSVLPLDVYLGPRRRIYLKGYDYNRKGERNFRVTRIEEITVNSVGSGSALYKVIPHN